MKTCPSCHKTYEDDSLVYCLDDGTRLGREGVDANATWNLPSPGPTIASPRQTSPGAQPTITAQPEHFQMAAPQASGGGERGERHRSALPWLFAIVLVLGASGILIAWIVMSGRTNNTSAGANNTNARTDIAGSESPAPTVEAPAIATPTSGGIGSGSGTPPYRPNPTPIRTPEITVRPTPPPERPKPMFTVLNNISYGGGSRITYYPRASFALCQADCAGNASCKALTWIRPGAYNPGDAAMCYLMYSVSGPVTHACCISAIKN